uniref:Ig-like domain-containing protein n=1 Tax=Sander lucioperca TaxID=283035 RepID=A0A8D0ACB0_SANLU
TAVKPCCTAICVKPRVKRWDWPKVITVEEGSDVTLPCSLWPKEDLTSTRFLWRKVSQNTDSFTFEKVFLYDKGHLYSDERPGQSEQFKGRVSHFPDKLKQGNASITIRNTTRADSGEYICRFPFTNPPQIFYIKLVVVGEYFDEPVKDVLSFKDWSLVSTLKINLISLILFCLFSCRFNSRANRTSSINDRRKALIMSVLLETFI